MRLQATGAELKGALEDEQRETKRLVGLVEKANADAGLQQERAARLESDMHQTKKQYAALKLWGRAEEATRRSAKRKVKALLQQRWKSWGAHLTALSWIGTLLSMLMEGRVSCLGFAQEIRVLGLRALGESRTDIERLETRCESLEIELHATSDRCSASDGRVKAAESALRAVETKYGNMQKWGLVVHRNAENLQASHSQLAAEYLALVRATRPLLSAMSDVEAAFGAVFKATGDSTRARLRELLDPKKVDETLRENAGALEISALTSLLLPDSAQAACPRSASPLNVVLQARRRKKQDCRASSLPQGGEPTRYVDTCDPMHNPIIARERTAGCTRATHTCAGCTRATHTCAQD